MAESGSPEDVKNLLTNLADVVAGQAHEGRPRERPRRRSDEPTPERDRFREEAQRMVAWNFRGQPVVEPPPSVGETVEAVLSRGKVHFDGRDGRTQGLLCVEIEKNRYWLRITDETVAEVVDENEQQ